MERTTMARETTAEQAAIAAKADHEVLDAGGFVVLKLDGGAYSYLAAPNPTASKREIFGPQAAELKQAEIAGRYLWRGGQWVNADGAAATTVPATAEPP